MTRRQLLQSLSAAAAGLLLPPLAMAAEAGKTAVAKLVKTKAQWKALLPAPSYKVLFEEDTEYPGSSPLNREKRAGLYVCAACKLPLFDSRHKFESGTGWPSFWQPLEGATEKKQDFLLLIPRTEYHCARCGGHQGHVFDDGPAPTGLRYCNNGVALNFVAAGDPLPALLS